MAYPHKAACKYVTHSLLVRWRDEAGMMKMTSSSKCVCVRTCMRVRACVCKCVCVCISK